MYFRRAMYCISQFKRFSDPNITKNVAKKNCFQLNCLFNSRENTRFQTHNDAKLM